MDELPDKMADKDHRRIILGLLEKRPPPYSRGDWQRASGDSGETSASSGKARTETGKTESGRSAQTASVGTGASSEERGKQLTGNTLRGRDYAIKSRHTMWYGDRKDQ